MPQCPAARILHFLYSLGWDEYIPAYDQPSVRCRFVEKSVAEFAQFAAKLKNVPKNRVVNTKQQRRTICLQQ